MERDNGFRAIAIIALVIAVAGLSIGYASLNRELTINGTATKEVANWDVHFENLSAATLVGTASEKAAASLTATNVTVDVSVVKPGDSVSYTFDVKNAGGIDAKLRALPIIAGLDTAAANDITVTLTHGDGTELSANETLAAGGTQPMKLTVTFDAEAEAVAAEAVPLTISTSLFYIQK